MKATSIILSAGTVVVSFFSSSFLSIPWVVDANEDYIHHDDDVLTSEVLDACTKGHMDVLREAVEEHGIEFLVTGRSPHGETCLHVAGIMGQPEVTRFILEHGGDANVRSSFAGGLRMHPLSWNVYGGHVETVKVLIEEGNANVNLDYDSGDTTRGPITALDTIMDILAVDAMGRDPELQKYHELKDLLLEHGAKKYEDVLMVSR